MGNREKVIVALGVIASITSLVIGMARTATVSEKIRVKPDYERLAHLLAAKQLTKAERQTYRMMLLALEKNTKYSDPIELNQQDIAKFPCQDLRKIEKIWHPYTQGNIHFRNKIMSWQNDQQNLSSAITSRLDICRIEDIKNSTVKQHSPEK
ncbi:GUN4 domain-containing protein [Planktothrix mougeotii]|uniref:GUN4 domain-containing protein n=1 Tax=Planktothrix mougeotii LEGE 06226 TaxID=1828728 RepID=A0ABR9UAK1_9CYAN|nr:GUN4 domain-containing protein [Planktothrix mougeotii]MBE9143485.1 GUN4 domain-containing protein [Planktothrix mougeotii LEGE 06226]